MAPEEEVLRRKIGEVWPTIYFSALLVLLVVWVLSVLAVESGWIVPRHYVIIGAPLLEEAIKGSLASLLGPILYTLHLRSSKSGDGLVGWALISGFLVGLYFGLGESILQGESVQGILAGMATHPIWTAAVSVGFSSFWRYGDKHSLIGIYLLAVLGHAAWNYHVCYPSPLATFVTIALLVAAIPIAILVSQKKG